MRPSWAPDQEYCVFYYDIILFSILVVHIGNICEVTKTQFVSVNQNKYVRTKVHDIVYIQQLLS